MSMEISDVVQRLIDTVNTANRESVRTDALTLLKFNYWNNQKAATFLKDYYKEIITPYKN